MTGPICLRCAVENNSQEAHCSISVTDHLGVASSGMRGYAGIKGSSSERDFLPGSREAGVAKWIFVPSVIQSSDFDLRLLAWGFSLASVPLPCDISDPRREVRGARLSNVVESVDRIL